MDPIRVAVVDWTGRDEDDLLTGVEALRQQVRLDFAPVWRVEADLVPVPARPGTSWPGCWGLVLVEPDGRDADRYQRPATADGHPLAVVRVAAGDRDWTLRASHELLELLADPDGTGAVRSASGTRLYAKRVCDPCAAAEHGYRRGGRLVSDFVYPAWFRDGDPGSGSRLDHASRLHEPLQALAGCSIGFVDATSSAWQYLPGTAEPVDVVATFRGIWPP